MDEIKRQAVKDALEFVGYRNNVDMKPEDFLKLIQDLTNFYNNEWSKQSNPAGADWKRPGS